MKTPALLFTSLTFAMTSLVANDRINPASEKMAHQLFSSFQQNADNEVALLFPTLNDFYSVMQQNSALYGDFLPEAKEAFAADYEKSLAPAFKQAYSNMLLEATYKGIDWKKAKLVSVKEEENASHPVTIVFTSHGKQYELIIEKTLAINGQWKPSQYMKLVLKA